VFEVLAARLESPLDSILSIQDANGRELTLNEDFNGTDSLLAFTVPATGDYFLFLRDVRYQGGDRHFYRISMGELPYVTAVFPVGGRPGATVPLELTGFNLGAAHAMPVTLPGDTGSSPVPMTLALPAGASNRIALAVDEAPDMLEVEPNDDPAKAQALTILSTVNGRIMPAAPGSRDADCYRFHAEKGETLVLEVLARRVGSPLDSLLAVTDAAGKELAVNDDAGGKDSRLEFTAPETGEYVARVTDLNERGGPTFTYRLAVTRAAPDFQLSFAPDRLAVGRGGRIPLVVTVERRHGFDGEITLHVDGLPQGVSVAGPARIRAGRKGAHLLLTASPDAPLQAARFGVTGSATIEGKSVVRMAQGREEIFQNNEKRTRPSTFPTMAAAEPPDMVVTAAPERLTLAPGKKVEITVSVARREGFKGKVPLAVLGLPEGIDASTPEIAEDKSEAKITLTASAEAKPGELDLVVVGRTDLGEQREVLHAAPPLVLTVTAAQ
jgi:hypothetical protein